MLGEGSFKNGRGKWAIAQQKNEFVIIVFGAPKEADGEALLKATEKKLLGK